MIRKINKKIYTVVVALAVVTPGLSPLTVKATEVIVETKDIDSIVSDNENELISHEDIFISFDEEGNIEYTHYTDVEGVDQDLLDSIAAETLDSGSTKIADPYGINTVTTELATISNVNYGVVVFNDRDGYSTVSYTDAKSGAAGYTNGLYGPDAAYLGMSDGKVKFMLSGVTGLVDASKVQVYEYDTFIENGLITSRYKVSNGRIYHQITTNLEKIASTQIVGYQQSYMKDDTIYYSYDGHYFYSTYKTMLTDYKNGNNNNAINPNNPYYNYYTYLSHRTKTSFTATQLNTYLTSKTSNTESKMIGLGNTFISAQNSYGANAVLMFGLAINESGYGNSSIAQAKNNLFGHGAVDSNPYYGSNGYDTPEESVIYHAEYFVSRQYLDAKTDSRYYGAHLGNKESGMNVKYASDPYWGEKAAAHGYQLEDVNTATIVDYNIETIGIVNGNVPIYNKPSGTILYYAKNKGYSATYNVPVLILDTITSNGETWYKIQSDMPVVSGRESVIFSQIYNYTNDYAYVKASLVTLINGEAAQGVMLGDANQDGKISSLDYMVVKNHIMGTSTLSGNGLSAADANQDGKISSLDYMLIKNHIMGTITLN